MKTNILDQSIIKTDKIYFFPIKFENYECKKIIDNTIQNKLQNKELIEFHENYQSEYIVGIGNPIIKNTNNFNIYSEENFNEVYVTYDDNKLLNDSLRLGSELLANNDNSGLISNKQKELCINFFKKYGLNNDDLFELNNDNGDFSVGCNLFHFINQIERITHCINHYMKDTNNALALHILSECNMSFMIIHNEDKHEFKHILVANTLIDVIKYQLGKVICYGTYIRKCKNPTCNTYLIGSRKNKETCSDACRKSYQRWKGRGEQNEWSNICKI